MKKLIIVLGLSFSLLLIGCKKEIASPIDRQWGKKREQPTKVWTDYRWIILRCDECGINDE